MKDITHFLSKVALLMALEQTPPFHSNLSTLHLKPCVGAAIVWVERAKTHSIHVALILASVLGTYCAWQLWRQLQKGCGSASAHTTVAKNGEPVFGAWLLASSLQKARYC